MDKHTDNKILYDNESLRQIQDSYETLIKIYSNEPCLDKDGFDEELDFIGEDIGKTIESLLGSEEIKTRLELSSNGLSNRVLEIKREAEHIHWRISYDLVERMGNYSSFVQKADKIETEMVNLFQTTEQVLNKINLIPIETKVVPIISKEYQKSKIKYDQTG